MERELWKIVSSAITAVDRGLRKGRYVHSAGRVVRVYLWAVLNDRPVSWACRRENWPGAKPPETLPHQSRMSRRLRQRDTQEFLGQVFHRLMPCGPELLKMIDGKPLPISRHSQDPDATFGRGAGGLDKGYKLHAIYGQSGRVLAWQVHPMNVDERKAAAELLGELDDEGYLLADSNYDSNVLYTHSHEHGQQLVAARRYGAERKLGHHAHSPQRLRSIDLLEGPGQFGRTLYKQRRQIETRFGNLCSFGAGLVCLPPWVRTLPRVRSFVTAKLIIRAARDRQLHQGAA
jgi:IS5 family transposase